MIGSGINGQNPAVTALPTAARTLTFSGAGSQASLEIKADGLVFFNTWVRQLTGAAGVATVEYQFQQQVTANLPNWQPFPPLADPISTTPTLRRFPLGAARYRILVTATGACTIAYRISASFA